VSIRTENAIEILSDLVRFPTISATSNLALVEHIAGYLESHGVAVQLSHDESGEMANLFATIGPQIDGGVVLSGHTDVVPVDGQDWSGDPFELQRRDGKLFARGAVDMKGFLACTLAMVPDFLAADLKRPIHLAFPFDEEIGSFGMPFLLEQMRGLGYWPDIAVIGEPTEMQIISGHKGGYEMRTEFRGLEGHASQPDKGVNAIVYGARFVNYLEALARELAAAPREGSPYDPPCTTISVGTFNGGVARNVIAGSCALDWELRPLPEDDGDALIERIRAYAMDELLPEMRKTSAEADIEIITEAAVPGIDHAAAGDAVELLHAVTGQNATDVVSFGTDGGHFQKAGLSTVVYGPGSIDQAHKPDEFITEAAISDYLVFLAKLSLHLARD